MTVYKIPPLKTNEGHRANDWGDLAKPLWKGRLRIVEKSGGLILQFEDATTGACVAIAIRCPAFLLIRVVFQANVSESSRE